MGHGKHVSGSSYPAPTAPLPPPVLTVIEAPGSMPDPDCRGDYYIGGKLNGKTYFPRMDNAFYIWFSLIKTSYIISVFLGVDPTDYWVNYEPWPEGLYVFLGDYIGDVIVIDKVLP